MSIVSFLIGCFKPYKEYQTVNKKDDDLGKEAADEWIKSHPLNNQVQFWANEKINAYAIKVIKDLQKDVPVTAANIEKIKNHLFQLGLLSERLQKCLIRKISQSTIDETFKKELVTQVIFAYPKNV